MICGFFAIFVGIRASNLVQRSVVQSQRDCIIQPSVGPIQRGPTLGCYIEGHNPERAEEILQREVAKPQRRNEGIPIQNRERLRAAAPLR
jgi:hypothetical protein